MCGPMVANTRVSGPRTTCMARASTLGRMVVAMRVTTSMIGSMVLEFTRGRTVDSMRATGTTASNMERVFIDNQTVLSAVVLGFIAFLNFPYAYFIWYKSPGIWSDFIM